MVKFSRLGGGARVADWGRLLSGCRGKNLDRGFESRPPRQKAPAVDCGRLIFNR
jgi:hypothetical protein